MCNDFAFEELKNSVHKFFPVFLNECIYLYAVDSGSSKDIFFFCDIMCLVQQNKKSGYHIEGTF